MTGIERLRTLAGAWDEWGLGGTLAEIADQIERERDVEVADSPYDAIRPEDRDAVAWVREHGGLDYVRAEWRSRVPRDRYERRRQRLLDHIAECETALGRRRRRIEELGHRVSDLTTENAELRKRPAVPASDGEPLEVGQTVWDTNGDELVIVALEDGGQTVTCRYADVGDGIPAHGMWSPSDLTHTKPELPKRCRDCRHWQGDPSASHMGVCFNSYMERCCVDSYAAQLDYAEACEDFEERGE